MLPGIDFDAYLLPENAGGLAREAPAEGRARREIIWKSYGIHGFFVKNSRKIFS